MATPEPNYVRLTRARLGFGSCQSLWLGKDHVLQVTFNGASEKYQQFVFTDIRGIFVGGSNSRNNWNIAFGLLLALGCLLIVSNTDPEMPVGSMITSAICAIGIVINTWVLGPSCRVYLVTQVQTVRLGALSRMRRAERVLQRLGPLIIAAQGGAPAAPVAESPAGT